MDTTTRPSPDYLSRSRLQTRFLDVRRQTQALCEPLAIEDFGVQSMPDVSPPKWHLAHTTWFFENFLLLPFAPRYQPFHPRFGYLFNSYYETVGTFHPRLERGLLSRPKVDEIYQYRAYVDEHMLGLLERGDVQAGKIAARVELGVQHEQQHQELLLTDIKHIFACNPLRPVYQARAGASPSAPTGKSWREIPAGIQTIGHSGAGFAFDNEMPKHRVYLERFRLQTRPVSNGEYLEFMQAGGYHNAAHWLSEGWRTVREKCWEAPLYWELIDGRWHTMTLSGMQPLVENEPVCHVSYYEADAYAHWAGKRLPTEAEWEVAAARNPVTGNFRESGRLHPAPMSEHDAEISFFGDVWQWTRSAYSPYPGFQAAAGALGEYNGKFMCSQLVLRGGSCVTPASHVRATYRNFFYPADRWQFTGFRLAE
jgi:ergothioneine biosynthesis protein EgtB